MNPVYSQIVSGKPIPARLPDSTQAVQIERKQWLALPVTIEILQTLASYKQDAEQSAKAFAVSGDIAGCARKMIEVNTLDKVITTLTNG